MSGPKDGQGGDAFDDLFGDPRPTEQMDPAAGRPGEASTTRMESVGGDAETPTQPTPAAQAVPPPEPTIATGAVPESWWASESGTPAAATGSTWGAAAAAPEPQRSRSGVSPLALIAMLVGGVLLGALVVGGAVMATGGDDEPPTAAPETVTTTSDPTPSESSPTSEETDEETDEETSSDDESESSSEDERTGKTPSGVSGCAGPSGGVAVGRGSDVTSCAFAVAVRDAYVAKDADTKKKVTLRVTSPVTDKAYTMSCTGEGVTRCTGGTNAVVVLY